MFLESRFAKKNFKHFNRSFLNFSYCKQHFYYIFYRP